MLHHRLLKEKIVYWLNKRKVIVITGARQVGKTTLLKEIFNNQEALWLNGDEAQFRSRIETITITGIQDLIGSYQTVIIDEIQRIANPGLLLKMMFDNFTNVQFVATGSSALEIADKVFEPLTGRHVLFHLYPFSLSEVYPTATSFELEQHLQFHLRFVSYPDIVNNPNDAELLISNLANQYLYKDVLIWKDIRKPDLLDKLLRLIAYQIGSENSLHELANSLKVKSETIENYLDLLEKSFVLFRLKSYSNNPRKEVSKMSKIYFWDLGIRNAIIGDFRPLELRNDVGALWENFLISERLKSHAWIGNNTKSYFWRDLQQREIDYIEANPAAIHAFEFKWNDTAKHKITKAFTNAYPQAITQIITPINFKSFIFGQ